MTESSDNNLVPKPNQGLLRLGKSFLMSRVRELATRQTEIGQVKGYR